MGNLVVRLQDYRPTGRKPSALYFTRAELSRLLGLYASRVIKGEWRDYAICSSPDSASFAVFKSAKEYPQFVISKLGRSDGKRVEVLSGLKAGMPYASTGSFVVKSELGKGSAEHTH